MNDFSINDLVIDIRTGKILGRAVEASGGWAVVVSGRDEYGNPTRADEYPVELLRRAR